MAKNAHEYTLENIDFPKWEFVIDLSNPTNITGAARNRDTNQMVLLQDPESMDSPSNTEYSTPSPQEALRAI